MNTRQRRSIYHRLFGTERTEHKQDVTFGCELAAYRRDSMPSSGAATKRLQRYFQSQYITRHHLSLESKIVKPGQKRDPIL